MCIFVSEITTTKLINTYISILNDRNLICYKLPSATVANFAKCVFVFIV